MNKEFGKLKVIEKVKNEKRRGYSYKCECECGNIKIIRVDNLKSGLVVSCGCHKNKNLQPAIKTVKFFEGTNVGFISSNKPNKKNTSGKKGVHYDKKAKKWKATIRLKGKNIYLGYYEKIEDAKNARIAAEEKYFYPIIEKYNNVIVNKK